MFTRSPVATTAAAASVVFIVFGGFFCAKENNSGNVPEDLVIFHAGSLAVPFREVSERFKKRFPGVNIRAESAGSRDTARKVSDLGRRCDVLASADYEVIDSLLIPEHADFNIRFAANEMVIAYTDDSAYADTITSRNWPEVLLAEGVIFGRSDPNRDPCGYRTVMVLQLAEKHYRIPGLAGRLGEKNGSKFIRPKEVDLLALLEVGEIDFLFIYRSVALQHQLRFVLLPDEVNLKSVRFRDLYATVTVDLSGKEPGQYVTRRGAPMVYGVTIPRNCRNRESAEAWVRLLLSEVGREVMERNGQPSIAPPLTDQLGMLPDSLKSLCRATGEGE